MDKLAQFLTSDRTPSKMAPETLELMGKQAATAYLERGVLPNKSILKLASENQSLTSDHLRRVCEFANTALYLHQHEMNKAASASSSYPQFPLADPAVVVQELTAQARPVIEQVVDSSYLQAPKSRHALQTAEKDAALARLFDYRDPGVTGPDCTYAWEEKKAESAETDLTAVKDQLKALKDNFTSLADKHDILFKEASDAYFEQVKTHLLEGGSFADVLVAARSTQAEDDNIAGILRPMVEKIVIEKVAKAENLQSAMRGIDKVANRVVNQEHPLVTLFSTILDSQQTVEKISSDLRDIDEDLATVNEVIKGSLRARPPR